MVCSEEPATGSAVNRVRRSSPRPPDGRRRWRRGCRPAARRTSSAGRRARPRRPALIRPLLSLTSSAVAGPTVPRIAAAKSLVGASGSSPATAPAPLMPDSAPKHLGRCSLLAVDDALHEGPRPGRLHLLDERPWRRCRAARPDCRPESTAWRAVSPVLSSPTRSTGRGVTSGCVLRAEDPAALGLDRGLDQPFARLQRRLHAGWAPTCTSQASPSEVLPLARCTVVS